jgi:membrane-bound serine protease (ClpP class)
MNKIALFLLTLILPVVISGMEEEEKLVYKLKIRQDITRATWRQVQQAFTAADSLNAGMVLIHMNTYGGAVQDADSIRTRILESKIPVVVFIDNNAASAGALISISCDSIYMRPGSSIGAATVVNQTGDVLPDKYQSYMRSTMRATAEAHGKKAITTGKDTIFKWRRDPRIAEAMVDPAVFIPGIIDTGKVLTLTAEEAVRNGYCEGIAGSVGEVLKINGYENAKIVEYKPSFIERIIGFLVHPVISGLLIMAIIGGIYFEMQSPGIGFPLAVAVTAAVLYFAPLYLEGLAENWEILLFIIGLALIAVEIFVVPGFGFTGIAGIVLSMTGLVLSLLDNVRFDFRDVDLWKIGTAVVIVFTGFSAGLVLSLWLGNKLFSARRGPFGTLALQTIQDTREGFISVDPGLLLLKGKTGKAVTVLRPSGKVEIGGEIYDAVTTGAFIDKGEPVTVTRVEATQLYVEGLL